MGERIERAQMEAILNAAWNHGGPVVGTTNPDGSMTIEYLEKE